MKKTINILIDFEGEDDTEIDRIVKLFIRVQNRDYQEISGTIINNFRLQPTNVGSSDGIR